MRRRSLRWDVRGSALLWLLLMSEGSIAAAQQPALVEFRQGDRLTTALTLVSEPHRTVLLGRDGWIYDSVRQPLLSAVQSADGVFSVISASELRNQLQAEFGHAFEVIPTAHYLVVQPRGRGDRWPKCFEQMHRQFIASMERRGVSTRVGRFPLVAIVLPDEASMQLTFAKMNIHQGRVAGVYDLSSNRVLLHDRGNAKGTAETIRHEAAHQTAYNTGVHSRICNTPRWIVEGVGSLFEPAIMERSQHGTRGDRVNKDLLLRLRMQKANGDSLADDVHQLVSSDARFQNQDDVAMAYAVAWAMTFYLSERQPQQFAAFIAHTSALPPFERYERTQRIDDFQAIIGVDTQRFAMQLERFLETL